MGEHREPTFDQVWDQIRALAGTTVPLAVRGQIEILEVDERGVLRKTSSGNISLMSIRSFQWTVDELNQSGELSRGEILEGIRRWESSGVVATLAATGLYELTGGPRVGLRVRR